MVNPEWRSRRDAYYRRVAIRFGVPPQFLEDAIHEIAQRVEAQDQRRWRSNANAAAIDQARKWARSRTDFHEGHAELPRSLDELMEANRDIETETAASPAGLDAQDKRRALSEMLGVLEPRHRAAMQLSLDGWPDTEIAVALAISPRRVGMLRQDALVQLRTALE